MQDSWKNMNNEVSLCKICDESFFDTLVIGCIRLLDVETPYLCRIADKVCLNQDSGNLGIFLTEPVPNYLYEMATPHGR